jgi:predicted transcriptional regulator
MLSAMPFSQEHRDRGGETTRARVALSERNALMVAQADNGFSFADIAREFGLTRQRVRKIVTRERDRAGQAA